MNSQDNATLPDEGGIYVGKYLPAGAAVVADLGDFKKNGILTGRIDQYSRHEIKTATTTLWLSWDKYDLLQEQQ